MVKRPQEFATVPKLLPNGGTVLVLGSGPSLTQADVTFARAHVDLTIAVNSSYKFAPDTDCLYAADGKWWGWHKGCLEPHKVGDEKYPAFIGPLKYCLARTPYNVPMLRRGPSTGLTMDPTKVALGLNGVYQSINLAVHFGASAVIVLGLDMRGGHFHLAHPDRSVPPFSLCIDRFKTLVEPLARIGVRVFNCTPNSAVKCFPMASLDDVCRQLLRRKAESSMPTEEASQSSNVPLVEDAGCHAE